MSGEHRGRVGRLKALRSQAPDAPFTEVLTKCQPESHGSLVELACIDLIERLRLGSAARVEDYTQSIDGLNNADDILDLLDAEICVRRELGESPTANEMMHRYPALRDEVSRLFEIDDIEQEINTPRQSPKTQLPKVPGFELTKELWSDAVSVIYRGRTVSKRTDSIVRLFAEGSRDDRALSMGLANATALRHPASLRITHFNAVEDRLFYATQNPNAVAMPSLTSKPVPGMTTARWLQPIAGAIALGSIEHQDPGLVTIYQIVVDHADRAMLIGYGERPATNMSEQVHEFGRLLFHLLTTAEFDPPALASLSSNHPALSVVVDQQLQQICRKCLGIGPDAQYSDFTEIVDALTSYLASPPPTSSPAQASFVDSLLTG